MENTTSSLLGSVIDILWESQNSTNNMTNTTVATTPPDPTPNPFPQRYLLTNTKYFVRTYTYLAFLTGIPGNFLTLVVLARMRPINSVQVWLMGLTSVDFLTLTVRGSIVPWQAYGLMPFTTAQCIFQYMCSWSSEYCNYLFFLSMTIERFIAVWFPLKMSSWTSPKKALIAMLSIVFIVIGVQLHHIWTFYGSKSGCYTRTEYYAFWNDIWVDKVEAILVRAIPLFSVLILNIMIAVKLGLNRGIKKAMSDDQLKEKQRQQRQINRLLTVATVFFFLSLMPDIIFRLTGKMWGNIYKVWVHARNYVIVMNTFAALRTGNHAGNFFCYIMVARKFRNELIHLVTCGRYGEHNGVKGRLVKTDKPVK